MAGCNVDGYIAYVLMCQRERQTGIKVIILLIQLDEMSMDNTSDATLDLHLGTFWYRLKIN